LPILLGTFFNKTIMAGNEIDTITFLLQNIGNIRLNHIGVVESIEAPLTNGGFKTINSIQELSIVSTEDSNKKADIYINGKGVSLKQSGASFPFNRLQRAELLEVFKSLQIQNPEEKLNLIDNEIDNFHKGLLQNRNQPWNKLFTENDFKILVRYLMTIGSPNLGISRHPAEFILESPKHNISLTNIKAFTFDEYFEIFKLDLFFAIRRQWVGQSSNSEHKRALGISNKEGNKKWVYNSISGEPRVSKTTGKKWRDDYPSDERKTVYMLFVEKTTNN
jgi:hypothetical protein